MHIKNNFLASPKNKWVCRSNLFDPHRWALTKVTFAFFSLLEHAVEQGSAMVAKCWACECVWLKLVFSPRILAGREICIKMGRWANQINF